MYSIVHVAMKTTKTSNCTCQSKCFISLLFTCQVLSCELQPFFWHDLANDIYSQTAKTVFSQWKTVGENGKNPSCKNLHFWSLETTKMANNNAKMCQRFGEKFEGDVERSPSKKNDLYWWKWRQEASLDFSFLFSANL